MHKLTRMRSVAGAMRLIARAEQRLAEVPEGFGGVAIGLLIADLARAREELAARDAADATPPALVPRIAPAAHGPPS